jgi:hypothetical protein
MTPEMVGVVLVLLAPALLFIGWLTLMATVVAALATSSDGELDEIRLLRAVPEASV